MVSFLIASCVDADMRIRHFFLNQLLKLLSDEDCQPENGVGGGGQGGGVRNIVQSYTLYSKTSNFYFYRWP